jgi:hypothetical protein
MLNYKQPWMTGPNLRQRWESSECWRRRRCTPVEEHGEVVQESLIAGAAERTAEAMFRPSLFEKTWGSLCGIQVLGHRHHDDFLNSYPFWCSEISALFIKMDPDLQPTESGNWRFSLIRLCISSSSASSSFPIILLAILPGNCGNLGFAMLARARFPLLNDTKSLSPSNHQVYLKPFKELRIYLLKVAG